MESYFKVSPELSKFKMIFADITHKCNMSCSNCYLPNRNVPDMDTEKLYSLLKKLPHSVELRLIGGEPTLRSDLPEIIQECLRIGHRTSLVTNGLKLADYDYCSKLKKAGLRIINISMNGGSIDNLYRQVDGGSYSKEKVEGLKNSLQLGFRVGISTIISKGRNEEAISDIIKTVINISKDLKLNYPHKKYSPLIRFKNIGAIGRFQRGGFMSFDSLVDLVKNKLNIDFTGDDSLAVRGSTYAITPHEARQKGYLTLYTNKGRKGILKSEVGDIIILINDWTCNDLGIPDPSNLNRGRITKDWMIAPFFEDVKLNEFGY